MITDETISEIAMREPPRLSLPAPSPLTATEILKTKKQQPDSLDIMQVARNVTSLVEDPDQMMRVIGGPAEDIEDIAPQTAQDLRDAMSKAIFFLASKAPKEQLASPGMPSLPPPKREISKFERYLHAVNDPTSILDDADAGTLMPESVEAVRNVYPKLYEAMQTELAAHIGNAPNIPYTRRMQLSALLGQDMTGTLKPAVALGAQSAYASAAQSNSPSKQMPVSRAQGLNMADRAEYNTAARREAQRGVGMWNKRG